MSDKPPRKPRKAAKKASKTTAKRGAGRKQPAPRKAQAGSGELPQSLKNEILLSKAKGQREINKARLARDIEIYENAQIENMNRRTKPTKKHKRGVPLHSLEMVDYDFENKRFYREPHWVSPDREVNITEREYRRLASNPYAVAQYIPVKEGKKIVAYRNSVTGEIVTPYYRNQVFGKYFRSIEGQGGLIRSSVYAESVREQQRIARKRHYNLVSSYQLRFPDMTTAEVLRDPEFQALVTELTAFNHGQHSVSFDYFADLQEGLSEKQKADVVKQLRSEYGKDPRYQEVLMLLGRRLPSDTNPVGESDPQHIKFTVAPYYEGQRNAVEFKEG